MGLGLILLIVAAVIAVLLIGIYNRLVTLRQNCNQAFADIDVQLSCAAGAASSVRMGLEALSVGSA